MHTFRQTNEFGFSLIEAMVSLVVVSVGMIGIASLYGQGLGASRTALYRTQAVNVAADMAERIRDNRLGGLDYGNAAGATNNNCDPPGAVNCSPQQLAQHDLWAWTGQVAAQLPNGVGTVTALDTIPPTYTIQVTWQETGLGAVSYSMVVRVPTSM